MCSCLWECAVNIKEWLRKQSRIVLSSVFSFCLKIVKLIADRSPMLLRGTNWFLLLHFFLLISYFISQPIERDGWTMHGEMKQNGYLLFSGFLPALSDGVVLPISFKEAVRSLASLWKPSPPYALCFMGHEERRNIVNLISDNKLWCFVSSCHKLASEAEETNMPSELCRWWGERGYRLLA